MLRSLCFQITAKQSCDTTTHQSLFQHTSRKWHSALRLSWKTMMEPFYTYGGILVNLLATGGWDRNPYFKRVPHNYLVPVFDLGVLNGTESGHRADEKRAIDVLCCLLNFLKISFIGYCPSREVVLGVVAPHRVLRPGCGCKSQDGFWTLAQTQKGGFDAFFFLIHRAPDVTSGMGPSSKVRVNFVWSLSSVQVKPLKKSERMLIWVLRVG